MDFKQPPKRSTPPSRSPQPGENSLSTRRHDSISSKDNPLRQSPQTVSRSSSASAERQTNPLARYAQRRKQEEAPAQKIVHRIEIKFLFPQFAKDSFKRIAGKFHPKPLIKKLGLKKILISIAAISVIVIGYSMYKQLLNRPVEITQDLGNGVTKSRIMEKPQYDTVLPSGKSIDQLGGWTRVSPPDRNPVFAYVDKIGSVPINVSQQPIPRDATRSNDDFVTTLAKSYLANDKVQAGDTTFYVGTSAKGPQSVLFNKGDTLILIRSSLKIDDTKWAQYISSLK